MTLSSCELGSQFTCDLGRCIPISQRCDNIRNCIDGSDEDECNLIDIPQSYDKLEPPKSKRLEPLIVSISIIIENIPKSISRKPTNPREIALSCYARILYISSVFYLILYYNLTKGDIVNKYIQ